MNINFLNFKMPKTKTGGKVRLGYNLKHLCNMWEVHTTETTIFNINTLLAFITN